MNDPRCLIADDHPALTSAVSSYLSENGFDVVGPASDGRRAVALRREKPDLALVDYRMPRLSGADLVRALREASPRDADRRLHRRRRRRLAREVLDAGAVALVLKEAPLADLVRALEAALNGAPTSTPHSPAAAGRQADPARARRARPARGGSPARGNRPQARNQLGDRRTHLRKASDRLGASTRTQAVATALRLGPNHVSDPSLARSSTPRGRLALRRGPRRHARDRRAAARASDGPTAPRSRPIAEGLAHFEVSSGADAPLGA